ncbi:MAG: DNA polymerase Y family protein [Gammaproteobacteria bacterium]|uniref:Y-family DNA polymerase n=1 Tax=Rhodoferax sp. TaxID=50421 RepID=UPI001D9B7811|nr:DNA polymerase Y family protein [Rhodoferax sp.]MBU3898146.1 DNA polymerase Y family protein [Gammaproteobacteria bacterium]MBU3999097.1 DNA polymerase Y family protein [Gammaproteobacteria bacterium]MBU4081660.1 DNA polymerase Y family protein [Gammaproteobacteria bacterium]MBU4113856.1 DNA polymerase Y family protein [Gammaproteobacteria bacterium]MBU4172785.1 DNA polymerase Y family protein [Gammaproteobacteria bacterium]
MHWIALQPRPDAVWSSAAASVAGEVPDALLALAEWALQYTPKVARLQDALLLELSASERLWGGKRALLRQIYTSNKPLAPVHYAQGATSLVAYARLQAPALARTLPDDLPLHTLVAARPHLATLERLGCSHWGQLRALPRGGVARRFGAPLLAALDQAYGVASDVYPWLALPEVFEATLELGFHVETAPALLFGARRLLAQLQRWLQLRQRGVLAVELVWHMDARRNTAPQGQLLLRSFEPSGDTSHLLRLAGEQLAQVTLPAPVHSLCLRTLETQKLTGETASLLPDARRPGDGLQQLLERLSARLGAQQVLQMQPCFDHRPEKMQRWQPAVNASQLIAFNPIETWARALKDKNNSVLYPSWLLATARPLALHQQRPQHQGPLMLLAGPQRLEAGWWEVGDCALRDYFLARSERLGLLWIYRERLSGQGRAAAGAASGASSEAGQGVDADAHWYLHGLFA